MFETMKSNEMYQMGSSGRMERAKPKRHFSSIILSALFQSVSISEHQQFWYWNIGSHIFTERVLNSILYYILYTVKKIRFRIKICVLCLCIMIYWRYLCLECYQTTTTTKNGVKCFVVEHVMADSGSSM